MNILFLYSFCPAGFSLLNWSTKQTDVAFKQLSFHWIIFNEFSAKKVMNRQHLNGWPLTQANILTTKPPKKWPQECIPVGWVPPTHWLYLIVSPMHVPLPCMPPCHACPPLPCMPHPPCHTCPAMHAPCHAHPLPCMPPNHACPPCHACPLPCRLPRHAYPPAMHAPCQACPPARHAPPWTEFLTHASENITLPQLRCGR